MQQKETYIANDFRFPICIHVTRWPTSPEQRKQSIALKANSRSFKKTISTNQACSCNQTRTQLNREAAVQIKWNISIVTFQENENVRSEDYPFRHCSCGVAMGHPITLFTHPVLMLPWSFSTLFLKKKYDQILEGYMLDLIIFSICPLGKSVLEPQYLWKIC